MTIYMIRDKMTGQFFKRGGEWRNKPDGASVWSTPGGPNGAKGAITRRNRIGVNRPGYKFREAEVITIECPDPKAAE